MASFLQSPLFHLCHCVSFVDSFSVRPISVVPDIQYTHYKWVLTL